MLLISVISLFQSVKPIATLAAPTDACSDSVIAGAASVCSPSAPGIRPLSSPNASATPLTDVPTVQLSSLRLPPSVALKSSATPPNAESTSTSTPIFPPQSPEVCSLKSSETSPPIVASCANTLVLSTIVPAVKIANTRFIIFSLFVKKTTGNQLLHIYLTLSWLKVNFHSKLTKVCCKYATLLLLGALPTLTYLIRQLMPFLALYLRLHLEMLTNNAVIR